MDEFDMFSVDIDSECLAQDFDDVDLYAEHTQVEDNAESNILFE